MWMPQGNIILVALIELIESDSADLPLHESDQACSLFHAFLGDSLTKDIDKMKCLNVGAAKMVV